MGCKQSAPTARRRPTGKGPGPQCDEWHREPPPPRASFLLKRLPRRPAALKSQSSYASSSVVKSALSSRRSCSARSPADCLGSMGGKWSGTPITPQDPKYTLGAAPLKRAAETHKVSFREDSCVVVTSPLIGNITDDTGHVVTPDVSPRNESFAVLVAADIGAPSVDATPWDGPLVALDSVPIVTVTSLSPTELTPEGEKNDEKCAGVAANTQHGAAGETVSSNEGDTTTMGEAEAALVVAAAITAPPPTWKAQLAGQTTKASNAGTSKKSSRKKGKHAGAKKCDPALAIVT